MAKKKTPKKAAKPKAAKANSRRPAVKPAKLDAKKKPRPPAPAARKAPPADDAVALGRVLVTQEEKLYMLFKEDYHARQIFEFLRVETVKDLEQFSPQQIVKLLSQPIQATVQRIRQRLADKNRHLAGDESFVVEFHKGKAAR